MHKSLLFYTFWLTACTQRNTPPLKTTIFDNQTGQTEVFVCGRGCRQYVLQADGVRYAPVGLPAAYQAENAMFTFSGELLPDSTVINKFGPDDRLMPDFKVRNLKINKITGK